MLSAVVPEDGLRVCQTRRVRACVIGAGPSGIVATKYLIDKGYEVTVFEKAHGIGGTFVNKVYDDTTLVSSKTITSFSDLRMGEGVDRDINGVLPDHPTVVRYVQYLHTYCKVFNLHPHMKFDTTVTRVIKCARTGMRESTSLSGIPESLQGSVYTVYYISSEGKSGDCAPLNDDGKIVTDENEVISAEFDCVVVSSGVHNQPHAPHDDEIPGLAVFRSSEGNKSLHSSEYKGNVEQKDGLFNGKNVLVVGSGETAMDISYRAVNTAGVGNVGMLARHGFLSIPYQMGNQCDKNAHKSTYTPKSRLGNGGVCGSANVNASEGGSVRGTSRPLDVFITNLFEHSYEHPLVHKLQLRWFISTYVIRFGLGLAGSTWGLNQWAGAVEDVKRGHHIINKSSAAMAHINAGVKNKRYGAYGRVWERMWGEVGLKPITLYGGKGVGIAMIDTHTHTKPCIDVSAKQTDLSHITKSTHDVFFDDGSVFKDVHTIIFATGYRQNFPFLDDEIKFSENAMKSEISSRTLTQEKSTESNCLTSFRHATGESLLPLVSLKTGHATHYIVDEDNNPGIAYIGFVRPNVGAIPPMSELQIQWYLQFLEKKLVRMDKYKFSREDRKPSYVLLAKKYQYGVDYGNYMHRVAEDMGSAPAFADVTLSIWARDMDLSARATTWVRVLFAYCLGQAHISLFRLQGPYASQSAGWDVVEGELCDVALARGWMENAGLLVMTMLFLWLNVSALLVEACLVCVGVQKKFEGFVRYI
eukprot:CFRG4998T1